MTQKTKPYFKINCILQEFLEIYFLNILVNLAMYYFFTKKINGPVWNFQANLSEQSCHSPWGIACAHVQLSAV